VGGVQAPHREEATKHLIECRLVPTALDRWIEGLRLEPASTCQHVAGVLFRAGFRNPDDIQRASIDDLLALKGIGRKSVPIVRHLKLAADGGA